MEDSLLKHNLQVWESHTSISFVGDQILIFHHNLQIISLKNPTMWFSGEKKSHFVCHSWSVPMMKITGLSLFKWENLHNWWLTKYFFAPLYSIESVNKIQIIGTCCSLHQATVELHIIPALYWNRTRFICIKHYIHCT